MKVSTFLTSAGFMVLLLHLFMLPDDLISHTPEIHSGFEIQSNVQPDTTGKHRLVQLARERGWVMIMVTWKLEGYEREGLLGQGQRYAQRGDIQQLQQQRLMELESMDLNIIVQRNMQVIPLTSMVVDKEALLYLYNSNKVERITENRYRKSHSSDSIEIIQSDYVNSHFALTGDESVVVIIDDGVERFHETFGGPSSPSRFINGACFSTNLSVPDPSDPENPIIINESLCPDGNDSEEGFSAGEPCEDDDIECDHGTFVAGIAVGENGVAPGALIVSINSSSKIYDPDACPKDENNNPIVPCKLFQDADLLAALQFVWTNNWLNQTASVNMSLGSGEFSSHCNNEVPEITDIIANITGQNVSVVAASGNESFANGISWPACMTNVISVGSTNKQDEHSSFSNAGILLDLVAPGEDITSSIPGNQYDQDQGTSFAAPHVAGTIALMRQANSNASFTQSAVRTILQNTADQVSGMGNSSRTNEYGHGRLNARAAVTEALIDNTFIDVIQSSFLIWDSDERNQFVPMYILEDATLIVDGTLNLYDDLYVVGTLQGSGCIELFGDAAIIDTYGENEFPPENFGDCDVEPEPFYPTVSDTTFTQSTVLADTLMLTGVTTFEPGVSVTVAENNLIIFADSLFLQGTGQSISELSSSGELVLSEGMYMNGGRLISLSGGEIEIETNAELHSTRVTVEEGGELKVRPGVTFDMNRSQLSVSGKASFGDGFTMQKGSFRLANGGEATFNNPYIEIFDPQSSFVKQHGFYSFGKLTLTGGLIEGEGSSYTWPGIYISGAGSADSFLSGTEIRDASYGVRIMNVADADIRANG